MNVETLFPMLASLCGLIAFVIVVVGIIRYMDSRTARGHTPVGLPDTPGPGPDPGAGGFYFVTANVWFIAGMVLLLGGENLFGYGRISPAVYWVAVWAAFSAAAVCARRWRAGVEVPVPGETPPSRA